MILAIRTDSSVAYLALLAPTGEVLVEQEWLAGRQLSVQLPSRIDSLLNDSGADYQDLEGLVVYQGPGSFTGLRIGVTIANTIAHTGSLPIVGATGKHWIGAGMKKLPGAKVGTILSPQYGGQANITKPKK